MHADALHQIRQVASLSPLSDRGLREVARLGRTLAFPQGTDLCTQPELADRTFYLLQGEMRVVSSMGGAEVLVGGTPSCAPLTQGRDLHVAHAITGVAVLCIDTDLLDVTMIWDQLNANPAMPDPHPAPGVVAEHLRRGALSALSPDRIALLLARFEAREVRRGEVILREGEPGDSYYVVDAGRCTVTRQFGSAVTELAELRPGDGFGEEALLLDAPRNATVTMKSDGRLYRLSKSDFDALLRAPLLRQLSPAEALKRQTSALWIDVRFPVEFNRNKLPWAINIPLSEIRHIFSVLDRSGEVVVYCQNGRRSAAAAFLLAQTGFKAFVLEGGLDALGADAASKPDQKSQP